MRRILPRQYVQATNILKAVTKEKRGLNDVLYSLPKGKRVNIQLLRRLVLSALDHREELRIICSYFKEKCSYNKQYVDEDKLSILATELLWVRGYLPDCEHQLVPWLLENADELRNIVANTPTKYVKEKVQIPRYIRINLLKTTVENVIQLFQSEGWVKLDTGATYEAYLSQLKNLDENNFIQDFHFHDILAFPPNTVFHNHYLHKKHFIILHCKSSSIPVKLLNPRPGSIILDMCAAPGIKTSLLAAHIDNIGEIHAVEKNLKRFTVLNDHMKNFGATCVKTYNLDVLQMKLADTIPNVTHILVDPSCSGSGMQRPEMLEEKPEDQIKNLSAFQFRALVKALWYPGVRRIVYCTCSLNALENEAVVRDALQFTNHTFKLVDAWPETGNQFKRGSTEYPGGELCLYVIPEKDLTTGFFVAVLERNSKKNMKQGNNNISRNETQKRKRPYESDWNSEEKRTKKMKNILNENTYDIELDEDFVVENISEFKQMQKPGKNTIKDYNEDNKIKEVNISQKMEVASNFDCELQTTLTTGSIGNIKLKNKKSNVESIMVDSSEMTQPKKKKKKVKLNDDIQVEETLQIDISKRNYIKKLKKSEVEENPINEEIIISNSFEIENIEKKNKDGEMQDMLQMDSFETKSKAKRNKLKAECNIDTVVKDSVVMNSSGKKKAKKKKKSTGDRDDKAEEILQVLTPETKFKKKRKKSEVAQMFDNKNLIMSNSSEIENVKKRNVDGGMQEMLQLDYTETNFKEKGRKSKVKCNVDTLLEDSVVINNSETKKVKKKKKSTDDRDGGVEEILQVLMSETKSKKKRKKSETGEILDNKDSTVANNLEIKKMKKKKKSKENLEDKVAVELQTNSLKMKNSKKKISRVEYSVDNETLIVTDTSETRKKKRKESLDTTEKKISQLETKSKKKRRRSEVE